MKLSENLKSLRKQSGLSQEQMAEKLNVSRQAITKWETDAGMPDISNLIAIAQLFSITVDELIGNEDGTARAPEFFYESITEYDISEARDYDLHLGSAKEIALSVAPNEKVQVRLASNTLKTLESDYKVAIDGHDINIKRSRKASETEAKEALYLFVSLPERFLDHTEIEANAETLTVNGFCDHTLELDGKLGRVSVSQSSAAIEITSTTDIALDYDEFSGRLELNLMSSTASLSIPQNSTYTLKKKGRSNSIILADGTLPDTAQATDEATGDILLKGFHSELVIHEVLADSNDFQN